MRMRSVMEWCTRASSGLPAASTRVLWNSSSRRATRAPSVRRLRGATSQTFSRPARAAFGPPARPRPPAPRPLDGGALEQGARVVEVVEEVKVERPPAPAALRVDLHVAFALEAEERLSHRRAGNASARGNLALREARAGEQAELEDVAFQRAVDRVAEVLRGRRNRALTPIFLPRVVHAGSGVDCQATICQPCGRFTQTLVKRLFSFFGWPPDRSWILTWPVTTAQSPWTWMSSIGRSTSW